MRARDPTPRGVLRVYVTLQLLSTLASSLVWGINTLFLLDAGLTVTEAFLANAFFTAGQVIFEVPTGVVADTRGRRPSYLLGAATLLATTLLYLALWWVRGPFWAWAAVSALLGLGFTFFSGATEAWLVDGLRATGWEGALDAAFSRGQIAMGAGMLAGTFAGGAIAQATSLGVPYAVRAAMLGLTLVVASAWMHDLGFERRRSAAVGPEVRRVLEASLRHGLGNPPVRWAMLAGIFTHGVPIYAFYALQPYLLELWGRRDYAIAGLAASIFAASQIAGGLLAPRLRGLFRRRTSAILAGVAVSAGALVAIGLVPRFGFVLAVVAVSSLATAAVQPMRQAYLNDLIPSAQRATVISSDNLLGSLGAAVAQPALGRVADVAGYGPAFVASGAVTLLAAPFVLLARRTRAPADAAGRPLPATAPSADR